MVGPPADGDPAFGSGFRPSIMVTNDGVRIVHGTRPQTPDTTGDGYVLASRTSIPPDGRFLTEFVSGQDGFGAVKKSFHTLMAFWFLLDIDLRLFANVSTDDIQDNRPNHQPNFARR